MLKFEQYLNEHIFKPKKIEDREATRKQIEDKYIESIKDKIFNLKICSDTDRTDEIVELAKKHNLILKDLKSYTFRPEHIRFSCLGTYNDIKKLYMDYMEFTDVELEKYMKKYSWSSWLECFKECISGHRINMLKNEEVVETFMSI